MAPDYARDAGIGAGIALVLAIASVWLFDYLRRQEPSPLQQQPVIQIAYPVLGQQPGSAVAIPIGQSATPLLPGVRADLVELGEDEVRALWTSAAGHGRLLLAALFNGIAPRELNQLRWQNVAFDAGTIEVPGSASRRLPMLEPLRRELLARRSEHPAPEGFILADGAGEPMTEASLDSQLLYMAHDAGLRRPEEVTANALHFTYAAFLARQGLRLTDLSSYLGGLPNALGAELMRLAPRRQTRDLQHAELSYPGVAIPG